MSASKNFDTILDDYAFFENHSTEGENDLKAYQKHLIDLNGGIQMLDFGGGTGSFTRQFLQMAGWSPQQLRLTLVEPGEIGRRKAVERLRAFSDYPVKDFGSLTTEVGNNYNLILSNHVLYYVDNLENILEQFYKCRLSEGKILLTMSGMENVLIQCWKFGFDLIEESIPYNIREDVENALIKLDIPFQKEEVSYKIHFPDNTENRMKMLRFLFNERLKRMPQDTLLSFWEPFVRNANIDLVSKHFLYII